MAELKPCPFCGGEAEIIQNDHFTDISCKDNDCCGFTYYLKFKTEEEAIEAWNRRADNEAEPVNHGRWLKTQEPLGWRDVDCVECSVCHDSWIVDEDFEFADFGDWDYCPSCGAKMMEGEA